MKTKVVCMGDSITEGFRLLPEECYPYRLGELLGDAYEVVNKGVCCCTTMDILLNGEQMGMPYTRQDRYREALQEQGDIYVILLGTNDAQDGMDDVEDIQYPLMNMISRKAEYTKNYQAILDSIKENAPHAVIYMGIPTPIMKCIWRKHQEKYLMELMPYYEELLIKNPEVKKIDIHSAYLALSQEELHGLYQEDGLHPNEKGAQMIAKIVCEKIKNKNL